MTCHQSAHCDGPHRDGLWILAASPRRVATATDGNEGGDDQEDEEDESAPDYSDLLTHVDDTTDLDDTEADELDAGIELDDLDADASGEDDGLHVDIGVDVGEPEESFVGEDESGPSSLDLGADLEALPPIDDGHDDENGGEELSELVANLPALDADAEEDETPGDVDPAALLDLEDDGTAVTREPWPGLTPDLPPGPRQAVRIGPEGAFLAGTTLECWTHDARCRELATLRTKVSGFTPTSDGHLLATVTGELFRRRGSQLSRIDSWRQQAGVSDSTACRLTLGGGPERIVLLADPGRLLSTEDDGDSWVPIDLGTRVLSISPGPSLWAAVETPEGGGLARAASSDHVVVVPEPDVRRIIGAGCLVDATDSAVAIGRPGAGVAVSTDGGKTFRRLPGLSSVTALSFGTLPGGLQLFAATFRTAGNFAVVHRADVRTGDVVCLGEIRVSDDEEEAAVLDLAFDDAERSLFAVGSFGVRVLGRPD